MNPNVIQFACQHCQSWLTVPVQMAGVSGPCPKCGGHITSPSASPVPEPQPPTANAPQWGAPPAAPVQALPSLPALSGGPVNPQAQAWASLPTRPPTGPLPNPVADAAGSAFFQNPPALPSGGMPSVAMQPSLLRPQPGGFPQGPAAAPPEAPGNPIAHAMAQMPASTGIDPSRPVSRPITVGGSRLSLLARQLGTAADGTQHLPPAPQPLTSPQPPRADRHPTTSMPRPQQGHAPTMADPQMRRGLNVTTRKASSGFAKVAAALVLLGTLGAAGWHFRGPLQEQAAKYGVDLSSMTAGLPNPTDSSIAGPVPGVDEMSAPAKPSEPAPAIAKAPPAPVPTPPTSEATAQRNLPLPPPLEEPAAPKAVLVEEAPPAMTRRAVPVMESPTEAPPAAEPVKPDAAMAAKTEPAPLVEVGRAKNDPKLAPESLRASVVVGLDRPIIKNVPPECESAAEALKKFLAANSWRERLAFIQLPGGMERKVQQYYAGNADGPVEVDEIEYYHHNENPQVGKGMHVVFVLRSRAWQFPMGVPVMVEVHNNEARVDWLTFVEFKDDLLNRFLTTYMEGPVRFHVGIRRTHYFEDDVPDKENMHAFEVAPPMGNCRGYVFVPKETPLARSLAGTLSWDKDLSLGVVELQWRRVGGQKWIEMTALPQLNWYSADGSASTDSSAPTSPVAKPPTGAAR